MEMAIVQNFFYLHIHTTYQPPLYEDWNVCPFHIKNNLVSKAWFKNVLCTYKNRVEPVRHNFFFEIPAKRTWQFFSVKLIYYTIDLLGCPSVAPSYWDISDNCLCIVEFFSWLFRRTWSGPASWLLPLTACGP